MNWEIRIAGNTVGGQAPTQRALDEAHHALENFCGMLTRIDNLGLEIAHQTTDVGYNQVWPESPTVGKAATEQTKAVAQPTATTTGEDRRSSQREMATVGTRHPETPGNELGNAANTPNQPQPGRERL